MAMTRVEKEQEVVALRKEVYEPNELVIVVHNNGLNSEETAELRREKSKEKIEYRVAKNTLTKRAIEGTKYAGLAGLFTGPTAIMASKDPISAARVAYNFAKEHEKFVIVGGATSAEVLDIERIKFLALLPSMDALRGKIVGILQAPAAQLARLANAYSEKGAAGGAAAPAAVAEAAPAPAAEATPPAEEPKS